MSKTQLNYLTEKFNVVGKDTLRIDSNEKITGSAIFGTDVNLPHMLYAKILRSKISHGKIISIDLSHAKKITGVKAIITAVDFPKVKLGLAIQDLELIARDKILYKGHPIAVVAAETLAIAEDAVSKINVEIEELPKLTNVDQAMDNNSISIHDDVKPLAEPKYQVNNLCSYTNLKKNYDEKIFDECDFVLEEKYETQMVNQVPIEPHACVANVDSSNKITVWTSTQSPFHARGGISTALNLPISDINVITSHTGGGFGGKVSVVIETFCILLSKKTGKPVKLVLSREEEFEAGTPRPPFKFIIKSGVNKNGKIVARKAKAIVDTGISGGEGAIWANIACLQLVGPYEIDHVFTEGFCIYTNKQPAGAFRAPGTTESAFAVESHMDSIAKSLGFDTLKFRLINVWKEGSEGATGQIVHGVGLTAALKKVAKMIDWNNVKLNDNQGIGIACGMIPSVGIHSSAATIKINEDGTVTVITGATDTGAGAITGLKMIAAEELTLSLDKVTILNADTNFTPWDGGSQGSRTTYASGSAVLRAARDVKNQLFELTSKKLEVSLDKLTLKNGKIFETNIPSNSLTIQDICIYSQFQFGGPVVGRGSFVADWPPYDKNTLNGFALFPSFHDPSFIAHACIVEIDKDTGIVKVVKYCAAHDVGFAINPLGIEGQIEGGVVQGLGYALFEEVHTDSEGTVINNSLGDYKVPTISDVPIIESAIITGFYGSGPYGAKGVGEANIVPPAPTVANAIFDALGVKINTLPLTPEKILDELSDR